MPHGLDQVIDFVNTRDLDLRTDALDSPAALRAWLAERELCGPLRLTADDLAAAHELREALRAVLRAHNGRSLDDDAPAVLDRAAADGQLAVCFNRRGAGAADVVVDGSGVSGALARLLIPVARASADGTWDRVKACSADDCQWAFYDRSRNRSGRWCDMAVCGNRVKVRAYREKRAGG